MSFTDYTSLKQSIGEWAHRGDISASASVTDDVIDLAEAVFNSEIRSREMEDFTATDSTAGYLIHPSDWLAHKSISYVRGGQKYDLQPFSEESGVVQLGGGGPTHGYVVRGNRTYLLGSLSGTFQMVYHKQIPALSTSATTNWLLTAYPQLYLYGCLLQLQGWGYHDERIPLWKSAHDETIAKINNASKLATYGQVPQMRPDRYY